MHFGASLRLVRQAAGFSLRDLGAAVGVSAAYLSRVEHGRDATPTPDRLVAIARALAVSPRVLLDLAGVAERPSREASFAARALHDEVLRRGLSPSQIARVLEFLDRSFPGEVRAPAGVVALLDPARVLVGARVSRVEDALDLAASRLWAPGDPGGVVEALRAVDPRGAAVGGGLLVVHTAAGLRRASLVVLGVGVPAETPDGLPVEAVLALSGVGRGAEGLALLSRAARLGEPAVWAAARAAADAEGVREVLRLAEGAG